MMLCFPTELVKNYGLFKPDLCVNLDTLCMYVGLICVHHECVCVAGLL